MAWFLHLLLSVHFSSKSATAAAVFKRFNLLFEDVNTIANHQVQSLSCSMFLK
jgi:hypothetical protein